MRLTPLVAAILVSASAASARADEEASARAPRVVLDVASCLDVRAEEVRRIVRVELRGALVDVGSSSATQVTVDCHNPLAIITVDDPITDKTLSRTVDLSTTARLARAHLLALSVVELVSASWSELTLESPAPSASRANVPDAVRESARAVVLSRSQRPPGARISLNSEALQYGGQSPLYGGGLALRLPWARRWSLETAMAITGGTSHTSLGEIQAQLLEGSLALLLEAEAGPFSLSGGAGVRLGGAFASARTDQPDRVLVSSQSGWVASVYGEGRMCALLARSFFAQASILGGDAVRGLRGTVATGEDFRIAGPFWGATLGIGFLL